MDKQMFWTPILILAIFAWPSNAKAEMTCGPGEYLVLAQKDVPDRCEQCPKRTYQDRGNHRETRCRFCSPFDHFDFRLVLRDECVPTHYIIIQCVPGYYLNKDKGRCHKCTNCTREGQVQKEACQKDMDALCHDLDPYRVGLLGRPDKGDECLQGGDNSIDLERHRRSPCAQPQRSSNGLDQIKGSILNSVSSFVKTLGFLLILLRISFA